MTQIKGISQRLKQFLVIRMCHKEGPVGVAIRGGKKVVCNDIENDP
jgi:hypothetical protein